MRPSLPRSLARVIALLPLFLAVAPAAASATWSIVAVDMSTRQVAIASATCVPQSRFVPPVRKGLIDIQAIVVPGVGVAAAQAAADNSRENQRLIFAELKKGTHPEQIIRMLHADTLIERRQFGIVDLQGRSAGHSGERNGVVSLHMSERVPGTEIVFSVQGNVLASDEVVYQAARAFREGEGDMLERMMRAMEAAEAEGGDRRCTCAADPQPVATAACTLKTAHVAYILLADPENPSGASYNDGAYTLFIDVTDQNILPHEDDSPVKTLRMRFDRWRAEQQQLAASR